MSEMTSDNSFATQVRIRAREKVVEIIHLKHEMNRMEMQLARAKEYLNTLNNFLIAEGQRPESFRETSTGSPVGKPGNRAKDYPVRKPEWEGMSLFDAVKVILEKTPNDTVHADVIAHMIYEIENPADLRKVKASLVSTLLRGGKEKGLWEIVGGNKYKAKVQNEQGRLASIGT